MQLHLNDDEAHLLREVLRSYLKELRGEIVDTDNAEYKRNLKRERDSLVAIAGRLEESPQGDEPTITGVLRVTAVWT